MPTTYTSTGLFIIRLLSYFIMQNLTVTSHSANQTSTCHKLEKFLSSFALYSIEARTSPCARNGTTPLPSRRLAIAKGGTHQLLPLFQISNFKYKDWKFGTYEKLCIREVVTKWKTALNSNKA